MTEAPIHFMIDLTLYPTSEGGRREAIARDNFATPCKLTSEDDMLYDCRLRLFGQVILPGETKRVGIRFLWDEHAPLFREARKFYLSDSRIYGVAELVD